MDSWKLLLDLVALLAASLLLGGLFSRFGQSPLVGYLLAGMTLGGPGSLQLVQSEGEIEAIAELGVSLLLFSLGLEFSVARLRSLGGRALFGGLLQVVVTLLAGAGIATFAGLPVTESLAIGAMVSLSSTAVVLRLLMERAEIDTPHGRTSLAVLLVQDMAVVPLAVMVGLLAGGGSVGEVAANVGRIVGLAALLVVALYLLLNKVAVVVLGTLTLERNRELTVLLSVVTGLGSTFAAHAIGISPALGAFLAGMFLGASPFATQIRADISSLRVILLTLFFGAAGMVADPLWILQNAHLVLGILLLLTATKAALVWGILRGLGVALPVAAATGISLAQIGEFAFVLGKIAKDGNVLSEENHLLLVSVAIVSLFVSPFLVPRAGAMGAWIAGRLGSARALSPTEGAARHPEPEVVIIGFGPAGQVAGKAFVDRPERVLVLDLNRELTRKAKELGFAGHLGDATQLDVLEHARLHAAKAVVITVPHHESAHTILCHIRRLAPAAHCVVRSRYQLHTAQLAEAGAHVVLGDEEQIGAALGSHMADWLSRNLGDSQQGSAPAGSGS